MRPQYSASTQRAIAETDARYEQQAQARAAEQQQRAREFDRAETDRRARAYHAGIRLRQAESAHEDARAARDEAIIACDLETATPADVEQAWVEVERAARDLHAARILAGYWQ